MNGETGFWHSLGVWSVPVSRSVEDPRGARHWGASSCHRLVCGRILILTMMQSCASAAKLRAAGPFSRSASSARFEYGFPPPRIVNSAVVLKASASAENGAEWYARSGKPLSGRWT
jgi:hypothetical protein